MPRCHLQKGHYLQVLIFRLLIPGAMSDIIAPVPDPPGGFCPSIFIIPGVSVVRFAFCCSLFISTESIDSGII